VHQPDGGGGDVDAGAAVPSDQIAGAPPAAVVRLKRPGVHWWLVLALIVLDQSSKLAVITTIPVFGSVGVVPGVLDLVHVHNPGVAFGFLNNLGPAYQKIVTTLLAVGALVGIAYYARHVRADEWLARLGLSIILGGALGNLIDRLRLGYVTDFVDVYWDSWHFWAFNVADASITIGAILVFADLLLVSRHAPDSV
jgi:signal peptidase II